MDDVELKKIVETLLFITDEPLSVDTIAKICDVKDVKYISEILEELKHSYDMEKRAIAIMQVAGGWQMSTRPEYGIWIRKLYQNRLTLRLSNAALEVLAIVAFRQPITKAEIEAIRGVDSSGPIDTLVERMLITNVGRKETIGRPIMYGTTEEFLKQFGLNSIKDLPSLESIVPSEAIKIIEERINTSSSKITKNPEANSDSNSENNLQNNSN
ncbi:MAG: SMC-Scp complex subunit ScpB [Elusimicrobiota bacterium]